jgi:hypothetical protein
VIEPTDEMIAILDRYAGRTHSRDGQAVAALREILAVAARDRCMQPRGHVYHPVRRWPSGRGANHPHYCVSCSDGETQGPGCGNCRSTGMDQTPWPRCEECRS